MSPVHAHIKTLILTQPSAKESNHTFSRNPISALRIKASNRTSFKQLTAADKI